jgi:predicted nucleic acid-binding protein
MLGDQDGDRRFGNSAIVGRRAGSRQANRASATLAAQTSYDDARCGTISGSPSYSVDINVRLALTWDPHPQNASAAQWFATVNEGTLLFCRLTMPGLLRLLTNPQVTGDSTTQCPPRSKHAIAGGGIRGRNSLPSRFPPKNDFVMRSARAPTFRTTAVADCYLAGFAAAAGARLLTFNSALAGTAASRRTSAALPAPLRAKAATRRRRPTWR